jgi:hypothetical protein
MELQFHRQIFEKYSVVKFNENLSNGAELFYDHVLTDVTKLIAAFRNFANVPKDEIHYFRKISILHVYVCEYREYFLGINAAGE